MGSMTMRARLVRSPSTRMIEASSRLTAASTSATERSDANATPRATTTRSGPMWRVRRSTSRLTASSALTTRRIAASVGRGAASPMISE